MKTKMKSLVLAIGSMVAMNMAMATEAETKPKIDIMAMGGTIAAASKSNTDMVNYKVGQVGVEAMIAAIPEMANFAQITGTQVANVPSPDLGYKEMLNLSKQINAKVKDGSTDGVVVTHGTDTLEETAFFLDITTPGTKPVIVVGAMRPATSMSADGTLNLLQSVALAANKESHNRGVMIVGSDRIQPAYYVSKTHASTVDTFKTPEAGSLGQIVGTTPYFFYEDTKIKNKPFFDVTEVKDLPLVSVVYLHTEADLPMLDAAVKNGAKGIVIVGSGNGSLPEPMKAKVKDLMDKNIPVVRTTRTGAGFVGKSEKMGGIGAGYLNAQKARILLALALTKTNSPAEIEKIFGSEK